MLESIGKVLRYGATGWLFVALSLLFVYLSWVLHMGWVFYLASAVTFIIGVILAWELISLMRKPVKLVEFRDGDLWVARCPKCGEEINSSQSGYIDHMVRKKTCVFDCNELI